MLGAVSLIAGYVGGLPALAALTPDLDKAPREAVRRPKIALALSGGGALGFAELGAMEWLEEHRIPVDAIAGTSAGALVGAWYATGTDLLSDQQVAHPPPHAGPRDMVLGGFAPVLSGIDFNQLFGSFPPYADSPMEAKRDRRDFPSDLGLGLANGRIESPDGLIQGQAIRLFLDRLMVRYPLRYLESHSTTGAPFDALPIPFRCVAAEIRGKRYSDWRTVVLGGSEPFPDLPGYQVPLPEALRASMAIPIVFSPVYVPPLTSPRGPTIHTLVDGGVIDNFPTDAAIDEFHPDALIGFRFGVDLAPLNMLLKATGHPTVPASVDEHSGAFKPGRGPVPKTVVTVDLSFGKLDTEDFSAWRTLAWIGYQSMERAYEKRYRKALDGLSLPLPEYLAYLRALRQRRSRLPTVPEEIQANGLDRQDASLLGGVAKGRDVAAEAVRERLDRVLNRIAAETAPASIGYDMDGGGALHVDPTYSAFGPPVVFANGRLAFDNLDPANYRIDSELWAPGRPILGADWRSRLDFGSDLSADSKIRWRNGPLFAEPLIGVASVKQYGYTGDVRTSEIRVTDERIGMTAGIQPDPRTELSVNLLTGQEHADTSVPSGSYQAVTMDLKHDSTNDALLPTRGLRAEGWLGGLFGLSGIDRDLPRLGAIGDLRVPTQGNDDPLVFRAGFGSSLHSQAPLLARYRLGGEDQMIGYGRDEIRTDAFEYGSLGYLYRLSRLPDFVGKVYLDARLETALANDRVWSDSALGLWLDTRFTPIYFGAARAGDGRMKWIFELGGPYHRPQEGFETPIGP